MNILIPYDDTTHARSALRAACRMAMPCDEVILVATIAVPNALPLNVPVGYVWKQSCRAERWLLHARHEIEQSGVAARCVRVRARNRADAIIAAATSNRADSVVFAVSGHLFSLLAMRFGTIATVARHVPCAVRVVFETAPEMPRRDECDAEKHDGPQRRCLSFQRAWRSTCRLTVSTADLPDPALPPQKTIEGVS